MLAAVGEAVNPAQVVPTRRPKPKTASPSAQAALMKKKTKAPFKKRPGKAAQAANRTAQLALITKQKKTSRKSPGKVAEADPGCAVRTT